MGKVVLLIILIVIAIAGWVVAGILIFRASADAVRIADLEATNKQLQDGNIALGKTVADYERERSSLYRQFEDAIGGAKGHAGEALKTVDRLLELSKDIGN